MMSDPPDTLLMRLQAIQAVLDNSLVLREELTQKFEVFPACA